ncbi:hypothetical protein SARC_02321 [Sphaeroforma arctica JP610]|uniref:Uncharacterized protein n=1 Tax=Sphaeroforma arctica JP610 TaxID=667725 RepID=A0A0L0G946_9EUKA|nr:hypothetical protein SARC_02321 [Sphaeroforma arctica JP610]KNC85520.1 hypothetical protein SARC_02321 [Sphaeroforma arctica JP610]|eukprot:XP_014159422.1 hypothetical protein SARC_02321 [Sphaeroforma arctica JP610]
MALTTNNSYVPPEGSQFNASLHELLHRQARDKANPHSKEALDDIHDQLSTKSRRQQQCKEFEREASGDEVLLLRQHNKPYTRKQQQASGGPDAPSSEDSSSDNGSASEGIFTPRPSLPKKDKTVPKGKETASTLPTVDDIAQSRQQLHARIIKLSEEHYRAIDISDTLCAVVIQPISKTLRVTVLTHFKAEKSTLDHIRDNTGRLKVWTPMLQIKQICYHETQATVNSAFRKLARGQNHNMHLPLMKQMTQLMENHRRAHERDDSDAAFKQNLLNHCIVQLLESAFNGRTYERTLQLLTSVPSDDKCAHVR